MTVGTRLSGLSGYKTSASLYVSWFLLAGGLPSMWVHPHIRVTDLIFPDEQRTLVTNGKSL